MGARTNCHRSGPHQGCRMKELIDAARAALAALDPDSSAARTLQDAIAKADRLKAKARCCFCETAGADVEGFSKKLKPRMAHQECAEAFAVRTTNFAFWC